jgi:predicted TIM-barrel fold metal-dependent hydrolase
MTPGTPEWLAQVTEKILDPERQIVDPHHHLWPPGQGLPYGINELVADTSAGHNVTATIFMECRASYRPDGPRHLRPLGETEFVVAAARDLADRFPDAAQIAAIVAHADLTLGDQLDEVLDGHAELSDGKFVGIRDALASAIEPEALMIAGRYEPDKYRNPAFLEGVRHLGSRGLVYDSWHYHHQLLQLRDVAQAAPDTTIVHDHFGTPVGVGSFANSREAIFEQWKSDTTELANCPNVVAKIGGLAMPDNGFGWHEADQPPTSDTFVAAQARYYHHTIEAFGPNRCMFESNFPVDRMSISYAVLWNGLKKIASQYSDAEQDAMFSGTARRVYGI